MRNKIEFINFKLQVATFQQINDWTLPLNEFIILKKKNTFPLQELIWAMILSTRSLKSLWDNLPDIDGTPKYFTGKFLSLKS